MKKVILLLLMGSLCACNQPLQITGKPDPNAATSGTLGSVKASDQLPAFDTPANRSRVDTARKP